MGAGGAFCSGVRPAPPRTSSTVLQRRAKLLACCPGVSPAAITIGGTGGGGLCVTSVNAVADMNRRFSSDSNMGHFLSVAALRVPAIFQATLARVAMPHQTDRAPSQFPATALGQYVPGRARETRVIAHVVVDVCRALRFDPF